jgi:hypothetical protein
MKAGRSREIPRSGTRAIVSLFLLVTGFSAISVAKRKQRKTGNRYNAKKNLGLGAAAYYGATRKAPSTHDANLGLVSGEGAHPLLETQLPNSSLSPERRGGCASKMTSPPEKSECRADDPADAPFETSNGKYPHADGTQVGKKLPFCWIEKQKLRLLEDIYSENTGLGSGETARSVYLALAEIASDNQRDKFEVSQAAIARRACVCVSTVKLILSVFNKLGLVKVKPNSTNGMRTRSTYTLVRGAIANGCLSIANSPENEMAISEEAFEESFEEKTARNKKNTLITNSFRFNRRNGEYEW